MKRKLLLVLAAGLLACLGLPALRQLWPRPGVTPDNFLRLRKGMTRQHVAAILGSPGRPEKPDTVWEGDRCRVSVQFADVNSALDGRLETDDGRVLTLPPEPPPPRGRLGWLFSWGPHPQPLVVCVNDGYGEHTPLWEWLGEASGLLLCLGLTALVVWWFMAAAAGCPGSGPRSGTPEA
jgi:hypothetical protein